MGSVRILKERQIVNGSSTDAGSSSTAVATQQAAAAAAKVQTGINAVTNSQSTQVDDGDTDASQTSDPNVKAAVVTQTAIINNSVTTVFLSTPNPDADKASVTSTATTTSATQTTVPPGPNVVKPSSTSSSSASSSGTSNTSSTSTSTSASNSSSPSTTTTNTASATTQTPPSSQVQVTSVVGGHTITTVVAVSPSSSTDGAQATAAVPHQQDLSTTQTFFQNKAAVGGVFGAVGLVSLILLLAIVLKIVRYRARRTFERELDEQVERETRAGTPFGFGKEDEDDLNVMGRAPGVSDPEKAYGHANNQPGQPYAFGSTAAYATYSSSAAAMQPAYYSPNSTGNGAPRRYPSQDTTQFDSRYYNNNNNNMNAVGGGELRRSGSRGSNGSYGTLNQPPMNAFSPVSGPNAGPVFAPATFNGNYGEYRNVSPPPASVNSASSGAPYGARPGTPSSLTPGGNRGFPGAAPAAPRSAFTPLGSRPDSPAILARYGQGHSSSRGSASDDTYASEAYAASSGGQYLQAPAGSTSGGNEPPSPRAALPNPFDQRG